MSESGPVQYYGVSARGRRVPQGERVFVERNGRREPLKHIVRHSPTGFSWGYAGSGPADLARSILADYLGLRPLEVRSGFYSPGDIPEIDGGLYQKFKFAIVAHLTMSEPWIIEGEVVGAFLRANPPRQVCPKHREPITPGDPLGYCIGCDDEAGRTVA